MREVWGSIPHTSRNVLSPLTFLSISLGLLFSRALLELHLSHVHHTGTVLVEVHDLVVVEAHDVEGFLREGEGEG